MSSENIFKALFITVFCNPSIGWVSPEYSGRIAEFQSRFIPSKKSGCEIYTLSDDDQLIFKEISELMEKENSELEPSKRKNPAEMKLMQCLDFFSKKENATISFTPVKAKKAISVPNPSNISSNESKMGKTLPNPVITRPKSEFIDGASLLSALKAGGGKQLSNEQSLRKRLSSLKQNKDSSFTISNEFMIELLGSLP